MKVSIWINNLEGQHFEVSNTAKSVIDIANSPTSESFVKFGCCNEYDLIQYDATRRAFLETTLKIIHKGKNEGETQFILKYIIEKIKEKSGLMMQIQVLKKIKSVEIQSIIDEIKTNVRTNYFELNIIDILNEFNMSKK